MEAPQETLLSKFAPRSFVVRLGVGVLILNLFVILMAVVSLRQSRRNHQDRATVTAQNLAQVLDRYVTDTLSQADLAVWAVKDEAERAAADPRSDHRDLDAFIRRQHERVPGLLALRTANAQGVIDRGTGPVVGAGICVADREYFIQARDLPGASLVISKPLLSRVVGQWVIILARRIERPDRGFAGIAYAVIALDQLQKTFSTLELGPNGSVALRDLDLRLMARYPEPSSAGTSIGQTFVSQELQAFVQSGRSQGIYQARTPFDQVQRTFAIRRLSGQPFFLLVGLAEQDYLAAWRREVLLESLEAALFLGLTLLVSWLIRRAWLRQQAAHGDLERLLTEVKTLGGMLPICSHCKKIRDDKGYWNQIEAYLNEHTDAEFTHGICPDCAKEVFPRTSGKHTVI